MTKKNLIVGQSGGPTAVINSSLYGVVSEGIAHSDEIGEVYGMVNGIEGFLEDRILNFREALPGEQLDYLKHTPGAYLGSCRYKLPESLEDPVYPLLFQKFEEMNIGWFFYIGGNDSMDTVSKLSRYAAKTGSSIRVIGEPKTIDNDLVHTDHTPGYGSAAKYVASTVREITLDASVYEKKSVTIIEIMGHKVGWVTLHAGIAGGADIILLPEIPYDMDVIAEAIDKRVKSGKKFTIIAVAEGAISKEDAKLSKKELKDKQAKKKYPSVAYEMAEKVQKRTQQEVRIAIPGHTQRGGSPCPFDRVLSTRLGAEAARAILDEDYGCMMSVKNDKIVRVPLSEVAGKLKYVDPKSEIIRQAKITGISFGDE